MAPAHTLTHNFSPHKPSNTTTTVVSSSTDPQVTPKPTIVIPGFVTTTMISPIIAVERQVFPCVVAGSKTSDNICINADNSSVDITNGWASTTSLATSVATTAYTVDANATPAINRRGGDGGARPGAAIAVTRLIFGPTLLLMLGPTVVARSTITPILNPITRSPSSYILFVTLICEVVAVTVEAFSTAFPRLDTELDDASSTFDWSEWMRLIARCLVTVAVVLFLVGVGSLAFEYASEA